jgi:hypothetical protein
MPGVVTKQGLASTRRVDVRHDEKNARAKVGIDLLGAAFSQIGDRLHRWLIGCSHALFRLWMAENARADCQ